MTDTGWIVTGLVTVVVALFFLVLRNIEGRLTDLEKWRTEHDQWAGGKAEELATVKETSRNVIWRLDRLDGRLDRIEGKIDRQSGRA